MLSPGHDMDPLTHTLAGASLAQTRFGRGPLATVTCLVGANLPDVDAATYVLGGDLSLGVRRGWTHGVLAMAVLPALLAWAMHEVDRVRCRRTPSANPVQTGWLLGLSYIAVLSHPALDWLNTYGVRLLMPFDGRWFYGDALFVVDPWVWLLLGTVVVSAHSGSRMLAAAWVALGVIATALVTGVAPVSLPFRILWCLGLALIAGLRVSGRLQHRLTSVATVCVILSAVYVGTMVGSARLAQHQVAEWARAHGLTPRRIMVSPMPGDPFRREVLMADDLHYHRLAFDWLATDRVQPRGVQTPIGDNHPAAAAALAAPEVWGLATWTRFPSFQVDPVRDGYRVTITDMRFGLGVVDLDSNFTPR